MPTAILPSKAKLAGRMWWAVGLGLVLGAVATAGVWRSPSHLLLGPPGDSYQSVWFMAWLPHALAHHLDPAVTMAAGLPSGANLTWNTWMPLAAATLSPITLAFGPVVAANLLAALAVAANVPAAFTLTRRVIPTHPRAALAGALMFGLAPYVSGQALGHPDLTCAAFLPLALTVLWDVATSQTRPSAGGLKLGLFTAAQMLLNEEIVLTTILALCCLAIWLATRHRKFLLSIAVRITRTLTVAAAAAVPIVAVPLAIQLLGPHRLSRPPYSAVYYSLNLANLIRPTSASHLVFTGPSADAFSGNASESTGYLLPFLVVLMATVPGWRRQRVAWAACAVSGAALVLALGPQLHVGGSSFAIPLPWTALGRLPGLSDMLPVRLTVISDLGLACACALGLGRLRLRSAAPLGQVSATLLLGLAALLLLPAWPVADFRPNVPAEISGPALLHTGDIVAFAPSADGSYRAVPMLWQALDGFRWSMVGGYLLQPALLDSPPAAIPPTCMKRPWVRCPPGLSRRLRSAGVSVVVITPSPEQSLFLRRLEPLLGAPRHLGDLYAWRLAR